MQDTQYEYMDELAKLCKDVNPPSDWRKQMHRATLEARVKFPQDSRNSSLYEKLLAFATLEFSETRHAKKATTNGVEYNHSRSSLMLSDLV